MNIDPRIPEAVQPIVKNYIFLTEKRLVGLINAFYIVGSIALGEFNEHFSDIDFLTILNRKATAVEIEHLHKIHQTIEKTYPRWKMSGSYIQFLDLGKLDDDVQPHPHFHDGVLSPAAANGLDSVTWWELKNHGVAVIGIEPRNLPFGVDWDLLITEMRENSITTKVRAAEYALGCLPLQWHPLIQEAINIRQRKTYSAYRFRFGRMVEAANFLKYIIHTYNVNSIR